MITADTILAPDIDLQIPSQRSDASAYIRELRIADTDVVEGAGRDLYLPTGDTFGSSKPKPVDQKSAGQNTVIVPKKLPDANYKAMMRTKLLAQMSARTLFDVKTQTDEYYKQYTEVLGMCGWVQDNGKWHEYEAKSSSLTISNVIIELLESVLTGPETGLFKDAMNVLRTGYSANEHVNLFGKDKASDRDVNFDLGVVGENDYHWPTLKPVFFSIAAKSDTTNILFTTLERSETKVFYARAVQTLNMDHYEKVREDVESKTEQAAKRYIANLKIKD